MAKKRVADVLVDTLVAAGVERVLGVAGDSLNGITDPFGYEITSPGCRSGMRKPLHSLRARKLI
jgi:thiamine pyrophosphate-dependent acetolactate synthase large subunit-like protein